MSLASYFRRLNHGQKILVLGLLLANLVIVSSQSRVDYRSYFTNIKRTYRGKGTTAKDRLVRKLKAAFASQKTRQRQRTYRATRNISNLQRLLDEADDAIAADDAVAADDAAADDLVDDQSFNADESCSEYLLEFLEGATDAKDTCEGISNAYTEAYCDIEESKKESQADDDDHDDYFQNYNHLTCCDSLKTYFDGYCSTSDILTNAHILLIAAVLLLCEMAKGVIKSNKLHFLPEAGGCILVGTLVGIVAHMIPNFSIDDISFDEEFFMIVLLPPIIFEAALSVNKKEFRRRRLAIMMFAVFGTILSTFMTGYMVHYASLLFKNSLPLLDSLIFGALISSIDPVAILSVLTNLSLTEEDTIFIMVFGESLLNDGIAITIFKTMIEKYDSGGAVNADEVLGAIADFLIIGSGSILIGIICGFACLIYFWFLRKKLNAAMEVGSFFLWAGIPYYICDEFELSGIVGIVTMGFFMDIYIAAPKNRLIAPQSKQQSFSDVDSHYVDLGDSMPCTSDTLCGAAPASPSARSLYSLRSLRTLKVRELLLREERFRLSAEADRHVRFVAHLLSQLSENIIFVYLGLFLFSAKYEWDFPLCVISILACILSRSIMVVIICSLVWHINILRQRFGYYKPMSHQADTEELPQVSRTATALQDPRIQLVLVLSGLRGAVSLALMESVPLYNSVTLKGSEYKPEMKAMTSASILFTMFVFGGSAYYILRKLDIPSDNPAPPMDTTLRSPTSGGNIQMVPTIREMPESEYSVKGDASSIAMATRNPSFKRPRPESPMRKGDSDIQLPNLS